MRKTGLFIIALLFCAGCVSHVEQSTTTTEITSTTKETTTTLAAASTTSTASTTTSTTPSMNLGLNESCLHGADCASRCCILLSGKRSCQPKSVCTNEVSESDCLGKGMYWCAGKCQKDSCSDCGNYMRCVTIDVNGSLTPMIEYATPYPGKAGSCSYNGRYSSAGGIGNYCDRKEGLLINAKCGTTVTFQDCMKTYGDACCPTYMVQQKRSFHSQAGEQYDLWCYKCVKVG